MFGEVNGKESVRDMSAHGGDVPEEKFEGRRPKFFWNMTIELSQLNQMQ
jgi:hypothetical protein